MNKAEFAASAQAALIKATAAVNAHPVVSGLVVSFIVGLVVGAVCF